MHSEQRILQGMTVRIDLITTEGHCMTSVPVTVSLPDWKYGVKRLHINLNSLLLHNVKLNTILLRNTCLIITWLMTLKKPLNQYVSKFQVRPTLEFRSFSRKAFFHTYFKCISSYVQRWDQCMTQVSWWRVVQRFCSRTLSALWQILLSFFFVICDCIILAKRGLLHEAKHMRLQSFSWINQWYFT